VITKKTEFIVAHNLQYVHVVSDTKG